MTVKFESIIFHDDHGFLTVPNGWPRYTRISTDMFVITNAARLFIDDDGHVVVSVSLESATYKLHSEQHGGPVINLELVRTQRFGCPP